MRIRKGVYRLEDGGFLSKYTVDILDRHLGFGDIWSDTFVSIFLGDVAMPQAFDTYTIHSYDVVAQIVQRCIN